VDEIGWRLFASYCFAQVRDFSPVNQGFSMRSVMTVTNVGSALANLAMIWLGACIAYLGGFSDSNAAINRGVIVGITLAAANLIVPAISGAASVSFTTQQPSTCIVVESTPLMPAAIAVLPIDLGFPA
jgi:hypothetical protein